MFIFFFASGDPAMPFQTPSEPATTKKLKFYKISSAKSASVLRQYETPNLNNLIVKDDWTGPYAKKTKVCNLLNIFNNFLRIRYIISFPGFLAPWDFPGDSFGNS